MERVFVSVVNNECGQFRDWLLNDPELSARFEFVHQKHLRDGGETLKNIYREIESCNTVFMILGQSGGRVPPYDKAVSAFVRRYEQVHQAKLTKEQIKTLSYTFWEGVIALALDKELVVCVPGDWESRPEIKRFFEFLNLDRRFRPDVYSPSQAEFLALAGHILEQARDRRPAGPGDHLFPSRYKTFRVARDTYVARGCELLRGQRPVLIFGPAGCGKTTLASEVCAKMVSFGETKHSVSISWIDVVAPTIEQAKENLLTAIKHRIASSPVEDPDKDELLSLKRLEGNNKAARILGRTTIVLNDMERGMQSYGNRQLTNSVLWSLTSLSVPRQGGRDAAPPLILTSRPGAFRMNDHDYDLPKQLQEDGSDGHIPDFALFVKPFDRIEARSLVDRNLYSLARDSLFELGDYQHLTEELESAIEGAQCTPLELLLLCELSAHSIKHPNVGERIREWVAMLARTERPPESDVVSDALQSYFPIAGLYQELWEMLSHRGGQRFVDELERALSLFSLGLNRTALNLRISSYSEKGRLLLARPAHRAHVVEDGADVYELGHPTVAYLCPLEQIVPSEEALKLLEESSAGARPFWDSEQTLLRLFCGSEEVEAVDLEHSVTEEEPRAAALMLASKLGIHSELVAYLATSTIECPVGSKEEEAWEKIRGRLAKAASEKVGESCRLDPRKLLTACRLCETLYQQLDEWLLKDEIIDALWSEEPNRPPCVNGSEVGPDYRFVDWYADPSALSGPGAIGREFLRQCYFLTWLENIEEAEGFPQIPLEAHEQRMLAYLDGARPDAAAEIRSAFANYLFLMSCAGEITEDFDLKVRASELSAKWFDLAGLRADSWRAWLNAKLAGVLVPQIKTAMHRPAASSDDGSVRQERIYDNMIGAYVDLGAAFGDSSSKSRIARNSAKKRIRSALEAIEEWPGDAWAGHQINIMKFGVELATDPDTAAGDLETWEAAVRKSLQFFDGAKIYYCTVVLLWNDVIKRVAYRSAQRGCSVQEALTDPELKTAFFRFLHKGGADRFAYLPEHLKEIATEEDALLEAAVKVPISTYQIARTIEVYARLCLPEEECAALLSEPTAPFAGESISDILDGPANNGPTDCGSWRDAVDRLFPRLGELTGERLPIPPFSAIEAALYRAVPKGLAKWIDG